jgi:hypothetical protein
MSKKTRRIVAIFLALTLAIGLTAHGARVAAMGVEMATAATGDMPMSGKCNDCGDSKQSMSLATCAAYCGGMTALPLMIMTAVDSPPAVMPTPESSSSRLGLSRPPDPYPPKSAVLI